jgi:murein DD-endopeptidase MepM/ murein hydrolase activator NlpD
MQPKNRYIRFFYERGDNSGIRTLTIRRSHAVAAIAVFAGIILTAIVLIALRSGEIARNATVAALRRENEQLADELLRFREEVRRLEGRMEVSFELQNRARLIASLDPVSEDVWRVGVGGPDLSRFEDSYPDSLFADVDASLDQMVRQSELQLESYREVMSILESEREVRLSTPSIRPVKSGFLSSRFGRRMDPFTGRIVHHSGVDYRARTGTPVMATADGVIGRCGRNGGFGLMIVVNHGNGFKTRYAHLSKILVVRGQKVKRGEVIGLVGNTGHSTGSHLHYEVIHRNSNRDPLQYVMAEGMCYD